MVSNRKFPQEQEEGNGAKIPIQKSKWGTADHTKQPSISGLRNVINGHNSYVETFLRRVVREEVERIIQEHHLSPRGTVNHNLAGTSGAKPFQLCFINKLPDTIFTLSNIIAEDESPLQIALFDVTSQSIVSEGPLSSIKIEICVLDGEFGSNGSEDWTQGEFNGSILRQRDGKGPLLTGDRFITLKNGIGSVSKLTLTDNSRWLRSRKFRLGAKVVESTSSGASIKEGSSEPFVVKDNRGESYKKHYPPYLNDDIWRLEKIAKDGKIHKRLSSQGIHTVKDLLQLYTTDPSSLYVKCGSIPIKSWTAIMNHAKTCVINDHKLYSYRATQQPIVLLFNSIYILVGVLNGQNYCLPDALTPKEKNLVETIKQQAYKNMNNLKSVDDTSPWSCFTPVACPRTGQSDVPDQVMAGQEETWLGSTQPCTSSSFIDEEVPSYQVYEDPLPETCEMLQNGYTGGEFFSGMFTEGNSWQLNGLSHIPVVQGGCSADNCSSEIQFTNDCSCSPYTAQWGDQNGYLFGSSDGAEFTSHPTFLNSNGDVSNSGKTKAVWFKIGNAIKWVISVKKYAAARKNAELYYCDFKY
ncbi:hypothetical protein HN51_039521 [Arachis hypogaea]|uniref:calmodulin-binding protein 60 B n=1 Tax=Arachis hypogaea TaxID=3818 RepID=UPI0007AF6404|nr:calmodulin-binding protein 60 F isoform X1 [Arachis ipaensis]XP_025662699.1 calmodulin-binding protein 60 F isoform X1 [Arachis hypogaea]